MMQLRKIALCVDNWWSEENHFAWSFTRKRLLQEEQDARFNDRIYILHVLTKHEKEGENWDRGTAVVGDVRTEMVPYDHSIVELHVYLLQQNCSQATYLADEGIHIAILSLKDQNRVRKTLSMGTATQILSRAGCACTVVSPRFSAGDHFRIQAKLQPDALVANSAMQYRRRVALVLNSSVWDSALTQYAATNVVLPGELVILVRCLNENLNKKNAEEMQLERDYLRELGWHKFKRAHVALAVEVIKSQTRALSDLVEEKGIDLLVMARSDSNKLKRSIKKENTSFQTFPHKSPCPFMMVPTNVLRGFGRFPVSSPCAVSHGQLVTPFRTSSGMPNSLFKRKTWSAALRGPGFRFLSQGHRRCQSLDSAEHSQGLESLDSVQRDDSIELSSSAIPDLETHEPQTSSKSTEQLIGGSTSETTASSVPIIVAADRDSKKDAAVRRLQRKVTEKEKEIICLKQRIRHLQNI